MGFITNDRIDWLLRRGDVEEALHEPVKKMAHEQDGVAAFVKLQSGGNACAEKKCQHLVGQKLMNLGTLKSSMA